MKVDPDGVIEQNGFGRVTKTVEKTVEGIQAFIQTLDVRVGLAVKG